MTAAALTTDTLYIVSDFWKPWSGDLSKAHWRTSMVTNSIVAARKWAGPESIITEHDSEEAWAIHATRVLPDAAITNAIAA
jgi:Tfp pilus tip-associated adhesin PilY1